MRHEEGSSLFLITCRKFWNVFFFSSTQSSFDYKVSWVFPMSVGLAPERKMRDIPIVKRRLSKNHSTVSTDTTRCHKRWLASVSRLVGSKTPECVCHGGNRKVGKPHSGWAGSVSSGNTSSPRAPFSLRDSF